MSNDWIPQTVKGVFSERQDNFTDNWNGEIWELSGIILLQGQQ